MRLIKIKNFTFVCFTKNTRSGFKHEAQMLINETFVSEGSEIALPSPQKCGTEFQKQTYLNLKVRELL